MTMREHTPRWPSQVTCPRCGASDGRLCVEGDDTLDGHFHTERMTAWKQTNQHGQSEVREWRVAWVSFSRKTRVKVFGSEIAAREWLRYCTTSWGPVATAQLSSRVVGPWEPEAKVGPQALDYESV